ncbi:MAG: lipid-transfer protein [Chrysiogenetes bacterium]|nr:lipid-transfer protein [Chrysiogenetes bacterium]
MGRKVFVVGVGMTKFEKPGARAGWDYPDMAKESGTKALEDAGISYDKVQQAAVGYCYGDSTCGERAIYELGMTGIPVYNVNNNCSTGSTALFLAKQLVEGGIVDCAMALGFEKMQKGSLQSHFNDRKNPMDKHMMAMMKLRQFVPAPPAPQIFGNAGREHMDKFGSELRHFAKIGYKNHKHSVNNPYSQFQDEYSLEDIQNAKMVYEPLTKLQCCPTSDGSGAAILASEDFVKKHNLQDKAVEIIGMAMATDGADTFSENDCRYLAGYGMTAAAAKSVYEQSGYGPENVDVCELHDCFSANELITYEGLGLAEEGTAHKLIDEDAFTYGGKTVVNPSGGLISKGHPLGATGLAQCSELNWQLRGEADKRQVEGAKIALQHNLGLGGAAVVTMYKKASF